MPDWRSTASRIRNSISSRIDSRNEQLSDHQLQQHQPQHQHQHQQQQQSPTDPSSNIIHSYVTQHSTAPSSHSHVPTPSVPSIDAASTGSSMSPVPGAFYIPNAIAQRASNNMPPADGAALRRQLALDALALVRELPCHASGWLFVKRDISKLSSLFRSQWMPYWAELRGGMLLCYEPVADHFSQTNLIKLVFPATNCIIDLKNTPHYSLLKLRRSDGNLVMRVNTPQAAQQWVVALQTYTVQYIATRLSEFDWIVAIGKGASGKVFLVRDNRTNARLALKVVDKSRVYRNNLTFQHIINERLVLEACSGCPFIIQLRYAFQTDSHLYFATDFYDGGDVFSLMQNNRGRLSERHARYIIAEIVLALSWLHERNIVYRDLKPENVVLDGNGHVRLADFGLAKVLKSERDYLTQTICGTTAYAAPEMLRSRAYSFALDLWCLGVFIYHILCGRTPFDFQNRSMEEMAEIQRTKQIRYSSSLSLEAVSLIEGLLRLEPSRRSSLNDVKRHPFFRGVDWMRVARKEGHADDVSKLVSSKDKSKKGLARLAETRAQQLGIDSEMSRSGMSGFDASEISSMTLDRYLLRNINADEWRHVSFSDDDDRSATAEFPGTVSRDGRERETRAIAGWAWTCSEASGHANFVRNVREGLVAVSDGVVDGGMGIGIAPIGSHGVGVGSGARRSLPTAVHGYGGYTQGRNGFGGGGGRSVLSHSGWNGAAQRGGGGANATATTSASGEGDVEGVVRPHGEAIRAVFRRRSADVSGGVGGVGGGGVGVGVGGGGGLGGRGRRALGRIGSTLREARERVSMDQLGWSRKSIERRRFGAWRGGGTGGAAS